MSSKRLSFVPVTVLVLAANLALVEGAAAQLKEVVVGIASTCPYGCWAGASDALRKLEGVTAVSRAPDAYNSTIEVRMDAPESLPDVDVWSEQFHRTANDSYAFRGVEVTVEAEIAKHGDAWFMRWAGLKQDVELAPLKHKLQWNRRKNRTRQPEPDEERAYHELAAAAAAAAGAALPDSTCRALITGPLVKSDGRLLLEVREFFVLAEPGAPKR